MSPETQTVLGTHSEEKIEAKKGPENEYFTVRNTLVEGKLKAKFKEGHKDSVPVPQILDKILEELKDVP